MGVKPHEVHIAFKSPGTLSNRAVLRDRIFGKNRVSVLDITRDRAHIIAERINEVEPVYLEGYTASLVSFARYVEELSLDINVNIKAIIATSEDLIEPHRKLLENVFDTRVYNRFGSREFCGAGCE